MKFKLLNIMATLVAAAAVCGGENLIREEFLPDNLGGILGWSGRSDSNAAIDVSYLAAEKPGEKPAVRVFCRSLVRHYGDCSFYVQSRLPLVKGAKYRLSAQVRTHGMEKVGPFRYWAEKTLLC